jgi:hypothetical protein
MEWFAFKLKFATVGDHIDNVNG